MQLEPLSQFVLARGLEDHADSSTYYVRAVIRDGKTDQLLDTVNLTDNGNRRFTKAWTVPPDPTGEGRDIIVTYTVYTDSGYTTKADNYGERFDEHRVWHQATHGGAGGADIDYKKVRKIISEEIDKIILPKATEPDFTPLSDSLQAILSEVRAIKIPEAEKVSFTPLMAKFDALEASLLKAVEQKEVTPVTDLAEVRSALADVQQALSQVNSEDMLKASNDTLERIRQFFGTDVEEIKTAIDKLSKKFGSIPYVAMKTINDTEE